jgi:hypothetical protein
MRRLFLLLALALPPTLGAQVSRKTALQSALLVQTDSLRAETNRPRNLAPRKTVIRRLATRIDSIVAASTPDTVVRVDTVIVGAPPSDSTPPDTAPPPPPPPSEPATLTFTAVTSETLYVRPKVPYIVFVRISVDSAGQHLSDTADVTLSDTSLAKLYFNPRSLQYEVYTLTTHTKSGVVVVMARRGNITETRAITVIGPAPQVSSVEVAFGDTWTGHWSHGMGSFAGDTQQATVCATIEAGGQRALGSPAVTVTYERIDSTSYVARPETGDALLALCTPIVGSPAPSVTKPVSWGLAQFDLVPGGSRVWLPHPLPPVP